MSKQDTVRVRPRPGIILAGIPATGADVAVELAQEWLANGLVVRDQLDKPRPDESPVRPSRPRR